MVDKSFWEKRRVLVTGHTGFKGAWLSIWLEAMGAIVKGIALPPNTNPNLFSLSGLDTKIDSEFLDIRDLEPLHRSITAFSPQVLIHMAAQPLVGASYEDPLETFSTNVMGTANVLECCKEQPSLEAVVVVTSDKCYENNGSGEVFLESDPMGGHDPYSCSKGCAELVTASYQRSFFSSSGAKIASARAGNVIGGGDWSDKRLIPDILQALTDSKPIMLRNPEAVRPWQHVLEPLSGYLMLAQRLYTEGSSFVGGWNFGPQQSDAKSVEWIVEKMGEVWGSPAPITLATEVVFDEARYLRLDISKVGERLGWSPRWPLETALEKVVSWHKAYCSNKDMYVECLSQIEQFCQ